ncbi:hypothetical protein [Photobacterium leiognathi]|uniref:hypothetical protein n=1 Tax=Photobacterium leiognathi TaxID=553611 RepID=UPI0029815B37|nr:hypothetical protein [Photobacterium leiognathi]
MTKTNIAPEKVTKPIQLLAAWLAGLIIVDGSFLLTASKNGLEHWSSSALIIAAILNVPIFLASIFLLQTRFRPEMQEDEYYSKYLATRYSKETGKVEEVLVNGVVDELKASIEDLRIQNVRNTRPIHSAPKTYSVAKSNMRISGFSDVNSRVQLNDLLPRFSDIFESLKKSNVKVDSTFGSTSVEANVPDKFAITFGDDIDFHLLKTILPIAYDNGAEIINHAQDNSALGNIYIGAYGYDLEGRVNHLLDDELVSKLIHPDTTMSDAIKLVS